MGMVSIARGAWVDAPKPAAADHLICAIGDVHGRADLLEPLLAALAGDVRAPGVARASCILLGDLIDRGQRVRDTLGLAAGGLAMFCDDGRVPVEDVLILGNHDAWLKAALEDRLPAHELSLWLSNGGGTTMRDFGLAAAARRPERVIDDLRQAVPQIVTQALARMVASHRIGAYVFVHAGMDPRRSLDDQPEEVVCWIRDPFLHPAQGWPFEVVVVHGHTPEDPYEQPTVRPHRINVDTAAVLTGVLTAVQFWGDRMRFLQARG